MAEQWTYKGKAVSVDYKDDDHAEVTIDDRSFSMVRQGETLRGWSCPEAYFMSDDLVALIRHIVDYWYIFTSPSFAPPDGAGHEDRPRPPGGVVSGHPTAMQHQPDAGDRDGDDAESGRAAGARRGRRR